MGLIIFGIVLIVFQLISLTGTMGTGGLNFFSDVPNIQVFVYDLMQFIGYFLVGIIGVILLISGVLSLKKGKRTTKAETTTPEYNSYQALLNENIEKNAPEVTQNEPVQIEKVAHNIKPTKRSSSKKPLIIVTYILFIAIIIALSAFCVLSIKEKESTISQLEGDNSDLQNEIQKLKTEQAISEYKMTNLEAKVENLSDTIDSNYYNISSLKQQIKDYKAEAELWKNKYMDTDPANVTYSYEFSSVNALITAIKKNPEAYHNKQVKVFGMIFAYENETYNRKAIALIDYKGEDLSDYTSYTSFRTLFFKNEKIEAKEGIEVT